MRQLTSYNILSRDLLLSSMAFYNRFQCGCKDRMELGSRMKWQIHIPVVWSPAVCDSGSVACALHVSAEGVDAV